MGFFVFCLLSMAEPPTFGTGYESGISIWTFLKVPPVIEECCSCLETKGFEDEGIFRVTGSFKDINFLKSEYESGKSSVDLSQVSTYSVAGVLTHFFNESPEPIFPFEVYDLCIESMEIDPISKRIDCVKNMLSILPIGNRLTIKRFLRILNECSKFSEVNKMTAQNLAIAMSPTMIRPKEETIETLIAHGETLGNLVELLITHYDEFFGRGENLTPDLPGSVPETFVRVYEQSKKDIENRLPKGWMDLHGPKQATDELPEEEKPIAKIQALVKGYLLRKKLRGLDFKYQTAYNRATWDYIRRESNFVHAMKRGIRDFETSLGDNKAGMRIKSLKSLSSSGSKGAQAKQAEVEVKLMINAFKEVIGNHEILYDELLSVWDSTWPGVKNIGAVLVSKYPLFGTYNTYVDMYCQVDRSISAKDANPELRKWLQKETGSKGYSRTLDDLLRLPFNHIQGLGGPIQQFLNTVLIYQKDPPDTNYIVKAFALLSRMQTVFNNLDKRLNYQRTSILENSILGLESGLSLASLDRTFICKCAANIDKQSQFVMVFNDICVVCTQSKDTLIYSFHFEL